MAEASSAVAFQFYVADDGIHYECSPKVLYIIARMFFKGTGKRFARIKNKIRSGTFPSSPLHFVLFETLLMIYYIFHPGLIWPIDTVMSYIDIAYRFLPWYANLNWLLQTFYITLPLAITFWFLYALLLHYCLRVLLTHISWVFEDPKRPTLKTKIWAICLKILCGYSTELLYSYQRALPKLPVPNLNSTISKYLDSVRPLLSDEEYKEIEDLSKDFLKNEGHRLQRFLTLRSWITQNYITEWWEDYVYLASGRKPTNPNENTSPYPGIMINSNYYILGLVFDKGPRRQASKAASLSHLFLEWKNKLENENVGPIKTPNKLVPLCMTQYKRIFGTTRIPKKGQDYLMQTTGRKSGHIIVYREGKFYKVDGYYRGKMVSAKQLEKTMEEILSDTTPASDAEKHLASFTALDRDEWADFREKYATTGANKRYMDMIDTAAFFLVLDTETKHYGNLPDEYYGEETLQYKQTYDNDRPYFSEYCKSLLTGNGSNRWFDKSITLIVFANGSTGMNLEHSFADAPVLGHLYEVVSIVETDYLVSAKSKKRVVYKNFMLKSDGKRYTPDGYLSGNGNVTSGKYERMEWKFNEEAARKIEIQNEIAVQAADSVTMKAGYFPHFGRETIKQCNCSPDAFLQMSMQLACYKSTGKFSLTYESAMTRLFRDGRTETVRPVTAESCKFVKTMLQDPIDVVEAHEALQCAMKVHVQKAKEATTGQGIDRHLFALFVVSKGKNIDSPFLSKVIVEPWKLSTSQTPTNQSGVDQTNFPECSTGGGGFGPVTRHGYGVSYIFTSGLICLHVSSFKDSPYTDAVKFYDEIVEAMVQIKNICSEAIALQKESAEKPAELTQQNGNGHLTKAPKLSKKFRYMSYNDSIAEPRVQSFSY
ncbi:Carnitine O-palmitoyltransferase 1, liver isoform-like isoform X2 [Oopsacas minuta]|uniref:Carnitine O-palmitoyltransferase 1, liver isoform-like isoform X2 n=1 Tax=Oopsacas minuta TaxID=111878 RepID=A0AAV7KD56_9METZ|nr:Carnitine O-palmitoyltransferase 1, liver isoform-like isoform X2 [Oopsacas minuta]